MTDEYLTQQVIDGPLNSHNVAIAFTIGMLIKMIDEFKLASRRGRQANLVLDEVKKLQKMLPTPLTEDQTQRASELFAKMYEELYKEYYVTPKKRTCATCYFSAKETKDVASSRVYITPGLDPKRCQACPTESGENYHLMYIPLRGKK